MSNHLVEDASDAGYVMDILDITSTPAPPRLGHPLRWEMGSHLKETVDLTRVTCRVIMKIGPMEILDKSYRLPDLLESMGTRLSGDPRPPAGPWRQAWDLQIPQAVPVARHRLHLRARTGEGKNFLALNIPVAFPAAGPRPTTTPAHRTAPGSTEISAGHCDPEHRDFPTATAAKDRGEAAVLLGPGGIPCRHHAESPTAFRQAVPHGTFAEEAIQKGAPYVTSTAAAQGYVPDRLIPVRRGSWMREELLERAGRRPRPRRSPAAAVIPSVPPGPRRPGPTGRRDRRTSAFTMRVKGARRLVATSAAILMAGGAAIGAVGTAAAAAPAVHTHVTTSRCFGDDWRCFDHGGFRFDHDFDHGGFRFHHRFDDDFDHGGFRFHHRFDHGFDGGPVVIIVR